MTNSSSVSSPRFDNAGALMKSWFNITRNSAEEGTIDIFDEIGYFGVTAKDFVAQLRAMSGLKAITLNINCPGGDCEDGLTIYDAIIAANATVTANVVGTAASMASVIMLAAQKIRIAENGRVMIHRVTAGGGGNPDDLDAVARIARQFEDRIIKLYLARTKAEEATVRDWMKASMGTWFFGQEAVDAGFADEVISGARASLMNARWAPMFTMLPRGLFDISALSAAPSHPSPNIETDPMKLTAEQKNRLHALLRKNDLSEAEKTELQTLSDQAKKDGYDAALAILEEDKAAAKKKAEEDAAKKITPEMQAAIDLGIKNGIDAGLKPLRDELAEVKNKVVQGVTIGNLPGAKPTGELDTDPAAKTMTRAAWNQLPARARHEFLTKGGKLTDA